MTIQDAVFQSDFKQVVQLLNDGMPWDLNDFSTKQAIRSIFQEEAFDLLDILIEKEVISLDIFEYDRFNNTIFEHFIKTKFSEKLGEYLSKIIGDVENIDDEIDRKTWMGLAIKNNANVNIIEILSNSGCDINTIDSKEQSYLFYTKDIQLTEFLINQGLDINKKRVDGKTAFFEVVASKDTDLIQLYLDNGIDVNTQDHQGNTVYSVVCFQIIDPEIFEQISNYDPPRFDLRNNEGQSVFMEFIQKFQNWDKEVKILEQFLNLGADLFQDELDLYENTVTASDLLAKQPVSIIDLLIKMDALNVETVDNRGNTWLHKVCKEDLNFEQSKAHELYKKVKKLLKAGANPNLKNDEDKSPIDYAQDDNLKSKSLAIMLKK